MPTKTDPTIGLLRLSLSVQRLSESVDKIDLIGSVNLSSKISSSSSEFKECAGSMTFRYFSLGCGSYCRVKKSISINFFLSRKYFLPLPATD